MPEAEEVFDNAAYIHLGYVTAAYQRQIASRILFMHSGAHENDTCTKQELRYWLRNKDA